MGAPAQHTSRPQPSNHMDMDAPLLAALCRRHAVLSSPTGWRVLCRFSWQARRALLNVTCQLRIAVGRLQYWLACIAEVRQAVSRVLRTMGPMGPRTSHGTP
jgi:hypothetical protein